MHQDPYPSDNTPYDDMPFDEVSFDDMSHESVPYEEFDEHVEMSIYAMNRARRRLVWLGLAVSLTATITLAICDPVLNIRLTIPALLCMSVANLCAGSLLFARRLVPVHAAFRYGYKSGRMDERIAWAGDL